MMQEIFICNNENELGGIARKLLDKYGNERIFALFGEMGIGKTTFIKTICAQLGITDEVTSPTFSIINEYIKPDGESLYHFDFYRIKLEEEAYDLGYEDYFYGGSYCFIEWPEKVEKLLPAETVRVFIKVGETDNSRKMLF
jgi:tRNA threonylcarbamoyladenosine biosynthesis protein TsaE